MQCKYVDQCRSSLFLITAEDRLHLQSPTPPSFPPYTYSTSQFVADHIFMNILSFYSSQTLPSERNTIWSTVWENSQVTMCICSLIWAFIVCWHRRIYKCLSCSFFSSLDRVNWRWGWGTFKGKPRTVKRKIHSLSWSSVFICVIILPAGPHQAKKCLWTCAKCTYSVVSNDSVSGHWRHWTDLCRSGPEVIKLFSCSTQLSMKFSLLINMKMPTIVGIFIFISREMFMLSCV